MKVAFHTLGCKVNQYETEVIKEQFFENGFKIMDENDIADIYIINTCSVTNLAERKSRQYIRRVKKLNPDAVIVVTGCYAQIETEDVRSIEEVDLVLGINEKHRILDAVKKFYEDKIKTCRVLPYEELDDYIELGFFSGMSSRTRAYIKVQEGCNRFCSYCVIPYARGKVRSRALKEIISEAKRLIELGFKEIVLTGINTALYGSESNFEVKCLQGYEQYIDSEIKGIEIVIKELSDLKGDFRIRLSSLEPTVIDDEYVKRILKYEKLCHHLHLSIQSGSDRILKLMNRSYNVAQYINIVSVLRKNDEFYGITTDVIVGFPDEKGADFRESIENIKDIEFLKVHAFPYSIRNGTRAAKMKGHLNGKIKKERMSELIELGSSMAESFMSKCVGIKRVVLFEEVVIIDGERYYTGYTDNYIKVYMKENDYEKNKLLNEFFECELERIFQDGMLCKVNI